MPARIVDLSEGRRRLLRLMQEIHFGSIEELEIRGGEPVFNPPPRVVREIMFGGENGPRPETAIKDFAVKVQVAELLDSLTRIGDGSIERLEVKHGIPFRMKLEDLMCA
jgi:hypothetical protein